MNKRWTRREFLRLAGMLGAGAALVGAGCTPSTPIPSAEGEIRQPLPSPTPTTAPTWADEPPEPTASPIPAEPTDAAEPVPPPAEQSSPAEESAYLAVARNGDPATLTERAVAAIGGIERFVQPGHDVIIKPNICVDYHTPEYAATTNPIVVGTLVGLCLGAGARRVRVMDRPFGGTPESAYARSGIEAAVHAAGGQMEIMHNAKYADTEIPEGRDIRSWSVYRDILTADVVINVPIAKHHSLARLTLAMKNLLGVVSNPSRLHANLGQRIADLNSLVRPTLTVVDAVRVLMRRGPTGGNLDDVQQMDTVIASHDFVAADAWAAGLFGVQPADIGYIRAGADMGLGQMDLTGLKIEEFSV